MEAFLYRSEQTTNAAAAQGIHRHDTNGGQKSTGMENRPRNGHLVERRGYTIDWHPRRTGEAFALHEPRTHGRLLFFNVEIIAVVASIRSRARQSIDEQ